MHVVASAEADSPAEELRAGVRVFRRGTGIAAWLRHTLLDGPQEPSGAARHAMGIVAPKVAGTILKRCYDMTWKRVWWPDRACLWYLPAVRFARELLTRNRYDALVTSSHPFTCHVVGHVLKRLVPDLPWLVDIGDPFSFAREMPLNNRLLYGFLNRAVERKVLRLADRVVVTNHRTVERYSETFGPWVDSKTRVIGPAIPNAVLSEKVSTFALSKGYVDIVFSGNLLNPVRRPQELMRWIAKLVRAWPKEEVPLRFHFMGDSAQDLRRIAATAAVEDVVECHGKLDRHEALAAIRASHVLLNCGNVTDYQLPSKVYEYMAAGKPIINVVFNERDPSIEALGVYEAVLHVRPKCDFMEGVVAFIRHGVGQPLPRTRALPPAVESHLVGRIAERYRELLQ